MAIIDSNPWDNKTRAGWFSTGSCSIDASSGTPGGANALKYTFPSGFVGGRSTANSGYDLDALNITELYVGAWVKYSSNWSWGTGNKLFYTFWCANSTCTSRNGIALSVGANTKQFNLTWHDPAANVSRVRHANVFNPTFAVNIWYWIEHHIKLNTMVSGVAQANGVYQAWVNDRQCLNYSDLIFTILATPKLATAHQYTSWATGTYTKPAEDYLWFDSTTLSSTFIGSPGGQGNAAPTCTMTAPANGATVSGPSVSVTADADDDVSVSQVQFKLDGANLGTADTVAPYAKTWDTTASTVAEGQHVLGAVATDGGGLTGTAATVTVTVANLVCTITAPANGQTVSGAFVTFSATASAPGGVANVVFKHGITIIATDTSSPYSTTWDTTILADGQYTLTATVSETGSTKTRVSAPVVVTVLNGVPDPIPADAIFPSEDTFLNLQPDDINSADPQIRIYGWPADGAGSKPANVILMKFDLVAIPTAATVSAATLSLYLEEADAAAAATMNIPAKRVTKANDPATATGAYTSTTQASSIEPQSLAIIQAVVPGPPWTPFAGANNDIPLARGDVAAAEVTTAISRTPGRFTWDIPVMVQNWVTTPATNYGLLLDHDTAGAVDCYRYFGSKNNLTVTHRPYLQVTYTVTISPTISGHVITLRWTDVATNEDGYELERKEGTGEYVLLVSLPRNATRYRDYGTLKTSTIYTYRLRAFNETPGGRQYSAYSSEVSKTTPATDVIPLPPTARDLVPNIASITVKWGDNSNNEQGFRVERKTGTGGTYAQIADVSTNITQYVDTTAVAGTLYYYRVLAYNAVGVSAYSAEMSGQTIAAPDPPINLLAE